jgi:hypothetical protein
MTMKLISPITLPLVAALMAGCTITTGERLIDYRSADGPEGAQVHVAVPSVTYVGELLETRADGILILSRGRIETGSGGKAHASETVVRLVPNARIESVQFERGAKPYGHKWLPGEAGARERFRLLSRFPQGLTPELFQQVLKMYGQTEPAGGTP